MHGLSFIPVIKLANWISVFVFHRPAQSSTEPDTSNEADLQDAVRKLASARTRLPATGRVIGIGVGR